VRLLTVIQNSPTGGRTILTSQRFAPRGSDLDIPWPVFQTFALQTLFTFAVSQTFSYIAKDGHEYGYYYVHHDGLVTDVDFALLEALRSAAPLPGYPLVRGELFNYGIRGTLFAKEDQGIP